jgi:DNA-nicking Smr family endonuclease
MGGERRPSANLGAAIPDGARDNDDAGAFAEAVRGARPLARGSNRLPMAPPAPRSRRGGPPAAVPGTAAPNVEEAGDTWVGRGDGADRRLLRRLRRGEIPVEATLDLHGRRRAEAARDLDRFLADARAAGRRCLLVIHGRGLHSGAAGPALRDVLRAALTRGDAAAGILAFASAPPPIGGAGATLVLLRR